MLGNDTNLTEETAAAMRELARTVTYAPPLRLAPRPEERVIRRAPRRWHQWATPLTAMAAVIVLAVSLVAIRDISNGRVAPPARPSPAAEGGGPATASPGGTAVTTAPTVARTRARAPATTTSPATSTAPTPTTSITFVPMQTATGGEFLTPSGNIECQIDSQAGQAGAYCQTTTPARSVTMDSAGHYTVCTGQQCLANAGDGTPTLFYGTETGVGPFRCESATTGVTCTADGRGFVISASGITPVPG